MKNLYLARGYILGCLSISAWFNVAARWRTLDYSDFIKMVCLNHFILRSSLAQIDLIRCPFILNRTPSLFSNSTALWGNSWGIKYGPVQLDLSLPVHKHNLELNKSTKSPTIKSQLSIFLVMVVLHLFLHRWIWTCLMLNTWLMIGHEMDFMRTNTGMDPNNIRNSPPNSSFEHF